MVARDGIEPPTPAFSGLLSTISPDVSRVTSTGLNTCMLEICNQWGQKSARTTQPGSEIKSRRAQSGAPDRSQAMSPGEPTMTHVGTSPSLSKQTTNAHSITRIPAAAVLSSRRGMKPAPNSKLYATLRNIPSRNRFGRPDSRSPPPPAPSPNGFAFLAGDDSKGLIGFVCPKRPSPHSHHSAPFHN